MKNERYLSDSNMSPPEFIHRFSTSTVSLWAYVPPIYVAVFVVGYKLRIVNTTIPSLFFCLLFNLLPPLFLLLFLVCIATHPMCSCSIQPVFVWCTYFDLNRGSVPQNSILGTGSQPILSFAKPVPFYRSLLLFYVVSQCALGWT